MPVDRLSIATLSSLCLDSFDGFDDKSGKPVMPVATKVCNRVESAQSRKSAY
jgi:hypothetical protein